MAAAGMLKTIIGAATFAALVVGFGHPALAQIRSEPPLSDAAGGLVLQTQGYDLWLPAPDWLDAAAQQSGGVRPLIDAMFRATPEQALLEIYPRGEGQALWTTLYGARLSIGSGFTLKAYRDAVVAGFARTCRPDRTGFFQLGADEGDGLAPLGYACGAFDPRLRLYAGLGEVMVMSFRQQGDAVALIFQQWRGKAFDPSDAASWPVQTSVVEARARQLQAHPRLTRTD